MPYGISLVFSVFIWFAVVITAYILNKKRRRVFNLIPAATLIALTILFLPIYSNEIGLNLSNILKIIFVSIINAIQCFTVDADFMIIEYCIDFVSDELYIVYSGWAAFLHLAAPIMSAGLILSLFNNVTAYRRYILKFRRDTYVLSEINERSIALAVSIHEKFPKSAIVFAGADNAEHMELAREADGICFNKNITDINLSLRGKNTKITFFIIGEDEQANIQNAISLTKKYKHRLNTDLYIISNRPETEMLTHPGKDAAIRVYRINETLQFIYNLLYEKDIFETAAADNNERVISAVIIGLGRIGVEMLKALCWLGQMEGYRLVINAFDIAEDAGKRFASLYPELMAHNKKAIPGDAFYDITIHSGVDCASAGFTEYLINIPAVTTAFVCAGADDINIDIALCLRQAIERVHPGANAPIYAVVYNSDKARQINENRLCNHNGDDYNITSVGGADTQYSYESLLLSEAEKKALELHKKWKNESSFYNHMYNYRSSMSAAIHEKWRLKYNADSINNDETEHRRWCAYMRSEGYAYSGDKSKRNDIAKLHDKLVPRTNK